MGVRSCSARADHTLPFGWRLVRYLRDLEGDVTTLFLAETVSMATIAWTLSVTSGAGDIQRTDERRGL